MDAWLPVAARSNLGPTRSLFLLERCRREGHSASADRIAGTPTLWAVRIAESGACALTLTERPHEAGHPVEGVKACIWAVH